MNVTSMNPLVRTRLFLRVRMWLTNTSEDTFILLDALELNATELIRACPRICLEIG